jgi:hypothetical protein
MIVAVRSVLLAAACATLFAAGVSVGPAIAQEAACKDESIQTSGKARFRIFSKELELQGHGTAKDRAIANWEKEVASKFGNRWRRWGNAKDTTSQCETAGKFVGRFTIECTVSGRPCETRVVVEDDEGKRLRAGEARGERDEDDADDVDDADDDREDASDERKRASSAYLLRRDRAAHRRYLDAIDRSYDSWPYRRAMAYQDYLARRRARNEARAWARVNARQRWLQRQRDWAEGAQKRRYAYWHRWRWDD